MEEDAATYPKIEVVIPTGYVKDYVLLYMIAALEWLDYPHDRMEITWAITTVKDTPELDETQDAYYNRVTRLMETAHIDCPWSINKVYISQKQAGTGFMPILKNRQYLRGHFLDGDADYFMMVGGDNPPLRDAAKRLLKLDADVAFGVSYQRPERDRALGIYPMVWKYAWTMDELKKYNLPLDKLEHFRNAFLNATLYVPIWAIPNWKRYKTMTTVAGGDGNCLTRREVIENIGWSLPGIVGGNLGYHSEDLHWFNQVNLAGYKTIVDLKYRVPHIHTTGENF